jgi:hypothetical protein
MAPAAPLAFDCVTCQVRGLHQQTLLHTALYAAAGLIVYGTPRIALRRQHPFCLSQPVSS